jgi:hypothetical protein
MTMPARFELSRASLPMSDQPDYQDPVERSQANFDNNCVKRSITVNPLLS